MLEPMSMELDDVMAAAFVARSPARSQLVASAAAPPSESLGPSATGYQPGVCNIGPAEIARRRRSGVIATVSTLILLAILVAINVPPLIRLIVFFPAAVAASGFLQAWLKFCAGFGWLGIFNFEEVGTTETVPSADARRRDRWMAIRIGLGSAAVGFVVALLAVALPA